MNNLYYTEMIGLSKFGDNGKGRGLKWTNEGLHHLTGKGTNVASFDEFKIDYFVKLHLVFGDDRFIRRSLRNRNGWNIN